MTPEDQDAVFSDLARRRLPSGGRRSPRISSFRLGKGLGHGDFGILNLHPAPPGVDGLLGGRSNSRSSIDYASIDLAQTPRLPGAVRSCWRLHYLRQADFASDRNPIGELLPRIRDADRRLTEFAASRHVRVNRGVPVEPRVGRSERTRGVRPGAGRSLSQFGYVDSERPEPELRGTDRLGIAR